MKYIIVAAISLIALTLYSNASEDSPISVETAKRIEIASRQALAKDFAELDANRAKRRKLIEETDALVLRLKYRLNIR